MTRHLAHLSWPDIAALDKEQGVVILPVGAVEQHGPHLPILTDTLLASTMVEAMLPLLADDVAAWALPPLPYSKSNEHINFPGTISLSASTLVAVLHDIAASVARAGFRRLAFVNGHGGNIALLEMAARDIRVATGLMVFSIQPGFQGDPPFPISDEERRLGLHGGELETSMILAVDPLLVDMSRAVKHFAQFPNTGTPLFFVGRAATAWLADDWSESGVFGDATIATVEKGEALIDHAAQKLAALVEVMSTFEVGEWKAG